jgi:hypothetical protein
MPYPSPTWPNLLDKKVWIREGGEVTKNFQQLKLSQESEDGVSTDLWRNIVVVDIPSFFLNAWDTKEC